MLTIDAVLSDRGSKYAVSGAPARDRAEVDGLLKGLKKKKKFAKATHNTWAILPSDGPPLKGDDGEAGAGMVILRMLERAELHDHLIIVTRWYGGTKLGGDRFRRVQDCVEAYLEARGSMGG
ncbi:YigZ family protein [Rhodalgimonas zhirmunskyi]|uniref:YigZ family protein n=1 Tax=Rhodalgimonas zhirmunskyi TaxID=2964767 RepID=A0AAJ1UBW1_9RHOB|nr:YigZ family protein [Rhodoalgimonas zhirmunskyi]MDQ2095670.1 YigZ family protein [Rhodoalgimonas zhirmunskyi]